MTLIKTFAAVAAGTVLAASAFAQSASEIRGASPYVAIENELPPKLIVDPGRAGIDGGDHLRQITLHQGILILERRQELGNGAGLPLGSDQSISPGALP